LAFSSKAAKKQEPTEDQEAANDEKEVSLKDKSDAESDQGWLRLV
jgi:hypothetical protein